MRSPVDCGMLGSGESGERKYASKGAFLLDITTRLKPRLSTRARADVVLDKLDNEEEVMGRKEGGRVESLRVRALCWGNGGVALTYKTPSHSVHTKHVKHVIQPSIQFIFYINFLYIYFALGNQRNALTGCNLI